MLDRHRDLAAATSARRADALADAVFRAICSQRGVVMGNLAVSPESCRLINPTRINFESWVEETDQRNDTVCWPSVR